MKKKYNIIAIYSNGRVMGEKRLGDALEDGWKVERVDVSYTILVYVLWKDSDAA